MTSRKCGRITQCMKVPYSTTDPSPICDQTPYSFQGGDVLSFFSEARRAFSGSKSQEMDDYSYRKQIRFDRGHVDMNGMASGSFFTNMLAKREL